MGLWDRQDCGTTPASGSPRNVPGTPWWDCGTDRTVGKLQGVGVPGMSRGLPGGTVGRTGLWDNSSQWESLGCSGDSLVGLWDRQDCGTTPASGSPRDVPGTPWWDCETDRTVGQLQPVGVLGMSRGLPGGTVGRTGLWDNSSQWESSGCSGDSLVGLWDRQDCGTTPGSGSPRGLPGGTDRTVGQFQPVGVLEMFRGLPGGTVGQTGLWDNSREWESSGCPGDCVGLGIVLLGIGLLANLDMSAMQASYTVKALISCKWSRISNNSLKYFMMKKDMYHDMSWYYMSRHIIHQSIS